MEAGDPEGWQSRCCLPLSSAVPLALVGAGPAGTPLEFSLVWHGKPARAEPMRFQKGVGLVQPATARASLVMQDAEILWWL